MLPRSGRPCLTCAARPASRTASPERIGRCQSTLRHACAKMRGRRGWEDASQLRLRATQRVPPRWSHSSPCAECDCEVSAAGCGRGTIETRGRRRASGMSRFEESVTLFGPSTCATRRQAVHTTGTSAALASEALDLTSTLAWLGRVPRVAAGGRAMYRTCMFFSDRVRGSKLRLQRASLIASCG